MLAKTITYKNYDDVEVSETYLFNLTRSELVKLQLTTPGGFSTMLQNIVDSKDVPSLVKIFSDIIHMSYGIKSDDGRTFVKDEAATKKFEQSLAYDELFMELISDADKAAAFINAILPKGTTPTEILSSVPKN